jgi:cysteine-S-conjugate beta-lyase
VDLPLAGSNPLTQLTLTDLRRRRSAKWREYPEDVLPLWVAEMDTLLAPPVHEALIGAIELGDTGYVDPGELPAAYSEFALARFGWVVEPELSAVVPDVMTGVTAVLDQVTRPGDGVVITTPVYAPFFAHINLAGRQVVEAPLDWSYSSGYSVDLDRLALAFAAPEATACLLSNPHNPTGLVFTREELLAIGALAEQHNVRLLVDEIHAPLVYPGGVPHTPILSLVDESEAAARAFAFVSASKGWNLPGLKCALALSGPEAGAELSRVPIEIRESAGLLGAIGSVAAFREGVEWLDALIAGLDANRVLLAELLATGAPDVGYRPPAATYLAWLDFRPLSLGDDPAATLLERGRIALYSGPLFGEPGRGFARLNFATSPEILTEAVTRIATALQ